MQEHERHIEHDPERIEQLVDLLFTGQDLPAELYDEIEAMLIDRYNDDILVEAMQKHWDALGDREQNRRQDRLAAKRTMEGISRKCADFPVKAKTRIPLRGRIPFRATAAVIPLFIMSGAIVLYLILSVTGKKAATDEKYISGHTIASVPESAQPMFPAQDITPTEDRTASGAEDGSQAIMHKPEFPVLTERKADKDAQQYTPEYETIYINANHDDKVVELPDGTTIKMNAGARLEYRSDFLDNRVLKIKGDAFLSVAKREGQTFEVLYNNMAVRVLGTEFYLNEYGTKAGVILQSGAVEISVADRTFMLEPKQQFMIDFNGVDFSLIELDEMDMIKLQRGALILRGSSLDEALAKIGDFFEVRMDIGSLSHSEPLWIKFDFADDLEDVMFTLQAICGGVFRYDIGEGCVTVEKI